MSVPFLVPVVVRSAGCLLAEMLTGAVLFAGKKAESDQLTVIYDVCGTPDENQWTDVKRFELHQNFPPKLPVQRTLRAHLEARGVRPLAVDLIDKLLTMCPSKRWSAEQALNHPYFTQDSGVPILRREEHPTYPGNNFEFETKQRRRRERERGEGERDRSRTRERGEHKGGQDKRRKRVSGDREREGRTKQRKLAVADTL